MHAADAHALPPPADGAGAPALFRVHAYTRPARLAGAALQALSAANLLHLALRLVLALTTGALLPPPLLLGLWLLLFSLLPGTLAWLLHAWVAAEVEVQPTQLVVRTRGAWFEVPFASLATVRPWKVPLPGPGFSLRLTSGRTFRSGLQLTDPTPLLAAVGRAHPPSAAGVHHPSTRFAHARSLVAGRRGLRLALKYGLFPLLPTAVFFRAHQFIAYGGLLGEYYQRGLGAYLKTLALTWLNTTAHLLLFASVWRALAEGICLLAAWVAPARAAGVRRAAEIAAGLVYYVGIPALVLVLFLQ